MRIVTNQKLVKRNSRIAQYLFFFSLGILFLGFFFTNQQLFGIKADSPDTEQLLLWLPSLVLPIGLISTLFSVRMTNLWVRRPRPEDALSENLKGLSNKSVLYNYYHFPARHVLICPQGVFAIITRFQDGKFSIDGEKWRSHKSGINRFFSLFRLDGIGDPYAEAQRAVNRVQQKLAPIAPDVEVKPLIIFVDPRARLDIHDPLVPILYADDKSEPNLKDYLRDLRGDAPPETPEKGKKGQPKKKKDNTSAVFPLTNDQIDAFEAATLKR